MAGPIGFTIYVMQGDPQQDGTQIITQANGLPVQLVAAFGEGSSLNQTLTGLGSIVIDDRGRQIVARPQIEKLLSLLRLNALESQRIRRGIEILIDQDLSDFPLEQSDGTSDDSDSAA